MMKIPDKIEVLYFVIYLGRFTGREKVANWGITFMVKWENDKGYYYKSISPRTLSKFKTPKKLFLRSSSPVYYNPYSHDLNSITQGSFYVNKEELAKGGF